MTTEELIEELKKYPSKEVYFRGVEQDYPITKVELENGDCKRTPEKYVVVGQGYYL